MISNKNGIQLKTSKSSNSNLQSARPDTDPPTPSNTPRLPFLQVPPPGPVRLPRSDTHILQRPPTRNPRPSNDKHNRLPRLAYRITSSIGLPPNRSSETPHARHSINHIHSNLPTSSNADRASNSNSNADFYSPRLPSDLTRSNHFQHRSVKTSNSNFQSSQNPLEDI